MKCRRFNNDDGYHRLSVKADWAELAAYYDDIVAGYATVRVPGFRPGKVPRTVIEKRFENAIIDNLSHRAAQRFGRDSIREAGIEVLGPVETEEIECVKGQIFRATLRFYPIPEINLPDIRNLITNDGGTDPRDQISLRLLDLVHFDILEGLVQNELALDGIDGGEAESAEWSTASDRIKLMLILKYIAWQEGIEVDEVDLNKRIARKAGELGTTRESLRAELEKEGGMQRLRDALLAESTLEYLMEINM